jgi:predicted ATP-binding protein involved in virulence
MKLRRISIKNFRNIKYLDMSLDESSTVIIAKNGEGKSTILDAITVLLGPFVGAFDYGKNPGISEKDVRLVIPEKGYENEAQYPTELQAEGFWETSIHSWTRARNSIKGRTTMKEAANLSGFGKQLQDAIRANGEQKLPLVAYYGTGRLWLLSVPGRSVTFSTKTGFLGI